MSDTATMWRKRVAEWRASGETRGSVQHAAWTHDEHPEVLVVLPSSRGQSRGPVVRLAQLVRAPQVPRDEVPRGAVVIELLDVRARITIEQGTDRQTLATVLKLLDRRAGR